MSIFRELRHKIKNPELCSEWDKMEIIPTLTVPSYDEE